MRKIWREPQLFYDNFFSDVLVLGACVVLSNILYIRYLWKIMVSNVNIVSVKKLFLTNSNEDICIYLAEKDFNKHFISYSREGRKIVLIHIFQSAEQERSLWFHCHKKQEISKQTTWILLKLFFHSPFCGYRKSLRWNSFFRLTARLWNSLAVEGFQMIYDLIDFRPQVNELLLSFLSIYSTFLYAFHLPSSFLVTRCFAVTLCIAFTEG